ncbi:MAG TPA: MFS transporter [Candidatus Acidoferrales bacterium]|nr:MFS transporter [Candidatus Acidoferrales bacterium]
MDAGTRDRVVPARHFHAVTASFLGWTLDAFDFFVVVFLFGTLADHFQVSKTTIVWTTTATLVTRPLGALLFGLLADRYGRRVPLMLNVIYFSLIELLCGFAPNFTVFLVLRALFGIGMGGEWGVGASLAMESAPKKLRGVLSGIVQSGYPMGYLLAAIAARFVLPTLGWRWMFWLGALPALLALYIRRSVPESEAWKEHRPPSTRAVLGSLGREWKLFGYLIVLMTFMMFLSHGTQDLYPDFLGTVHRIVPANVSYIVMLSSVGAVVGALIFGHLSQNIGRRYSMIAALCVSIAVIPLWAFSRTAALLAVGAFVMQAGVQGAWGIIPVHLNELAPDYARGLVPGLAYQFGIIVAAPTNNFEYALRDKLGYQWALAGFEIVVICVLAVLLLLGRERHGREFRAQETATPQPKQN